VEFAAYSSEKYNTAFSLAKFVPPPPEGMPGYKWYDWRVTNWGTKWDVVACIDHTPGRAIFQFNSAWSPPGPVIVAAAEKFPMLEFEHVYYERGCDFGGVATFSEGICISNIEEGALETELRCYGVVNRSCATCWEDVETTEVHGKVYCDECMENQCACCDHPKDEHADGGKCLYEPTTFMALKDALNNGIRKDPD